MDLDVSHYTPEDMMSLLGLDPLTLSRDTIENAVQSKLSKPGLRPEVIEFYKDMERRLSDTLPPTPTPTYQVDTAPGVLNPDLKNTVTRFINIDSSSRMELFPNNLSSDSFTFELTEPLQNVLSMSLYSVEIPQSWYNITAKKGTSAFIMYTTIELNQTTSVIVVPDGNYSTLGILSTVQTAIAAQLPSSVTVTVDYSPTSGKCEFHFQMNSPEQLLVQMVWFDSSFQYESMLETRVNSSLGWMLGFREAVSTSVWNAAQSVAVMQASSIVDPSGTKYVVLALNDYKTNRINRSMLGVNTHPHTLIKKTQVYQDGLSQFKTSTSRLRYLHASPRTVPDTTLQSINAISSQVNMKNRFAAYESSDAFAKIPLKKTDWNKMDTSGITITDNNPARLIVEAGGPLQMQSREYFGPVEITNLMVELYDDKGNLLGLNGMDWSCTLVVKSLYQY